ncbi:hypothetical protein NCC49_004644 [Naganishia albida]|nr:hypothetical protein NCC49_004644 [Naganishia albida]
MPRLSIVTKQPTAFTPLPPHLLTTPPPQSTSTFHLTFPSHESARLAALAIDRTPARFLGFPGGPKRAEDASLAAAAAAAAAGKRSAAARGRVSVRRVEQDAERWLMTDAAREWTLTHPRPSVHSDTTSLASASSTEQDERAGTLPHYLSRLRAHHPAPFDPAKRGLQVLLRGVPSSATEEQVRTLVDGFKVDDTYGVWRVPKTSRDNTAIHIISLPSTSEAHRFVRAVHNRRYGGQQFARDYVMRAEVVW